MMLLLCFNELWWNCLHWYIVPGFADVSLLSYYAHCLQGHTAPTPTGLQWGIALGVILVGQLCACQISFSPLPHPKSSTELTWMVSLLMPGSMCVGQVCDGSNWVFSHCLPHKDHVPVWHNGRQMHRPTQILKALGRMSFCCNAKFWYLHGSWFLVSSWWNMCILVTLEPIICGAHADWPSWPWVKQTVLLWWWIKHAFWLTFDLQLINFVWYWSWFVTGSTSPTGWYGLVLSFLIPVNLQRLVISSLSKQPVMDN